MFSVSARQGWVFGQAQGVWRRSASPGDYRKTWPVRLSAVPQIKGNAHQLALDLTRNGLYEVRLRGPAYGFEPATDVHLRMGLAAIVTCAMGFRGVCVPPQDGQLRITALNHKPVSGMVSDGSADFTPEFFQR